MASLNDLLFSRHLDEDEEVSAIIHKHWIVGLKFLFWPSVSFVLSWIILYFVPFRLMFYAVSLLAVFSLVWWLRNFFDYYLDAWIITDQGIIDVEWHGWFHRESTRVLFSDIQGVSYEINGVVGTVMRYGTLSVEKISTGSAMSLEYVCKPREVESTILKNMEGYLHSKNMKDSTHVQEILSALVAREMQLQEFEDDEDDDEEYEGDDDDEDYEDDE